MLRIGLRLCHHGWRRMDVHRKRSAFGELMLPTVTPNVPPKENGGQGMLAGKRILLIIGGGIAAYKSLELIRLLSREGASVVPVLTRAGAEFVTPLSVSALAGGACTPSFLI